MIRSATHDDIPVMCEIAQIFCEESNLPATFDREQAERTFRVFIDHPNCEVLLAEVEDGIAGGVMLHFERDFLVETYGYVSKFFVKPSARGMGPGRALVEAAIASAREHGASALFASATAGIDPRTEQLFVALFKRHGLSELGRIVWRSI